MRIRSWILALVAGGALVLFNSCSNGNSSSTTLGTGFMWVATTGDQTLSSLTIDLSNGSVSSVKSTAQTGPSPSAMALTPDGTFLFVANFGDDSIAVYKVNSDGTVSVPCPSSNSKCSIVSIPVIANSTAPTAMGLAIDPSGKLLFVSSQGNSGPLGQAGTVPGTITVFSIASFDQNAGTMTSTAFPGSLPGDVIANGPLGMAIPASGNYLYVADEFTSTVAAYTYDSNGNLALINSYPVAANPTALAFSRIVAASNRDNFLFVSNTGSNQVSVFSACVATSLNCAAANGLLSSIGAPFSAPTGPGQIIVDPAFDWVYVVEKNSNQVSQFSFAPATGALAALSPAFISVGSGPVSGGITSDGKWVFVANGLGSNLSALGVGGSGKLSPASTSTVLIASQPSAVLVR